MRPSGSGLLFAGIFLITVSIIVLTTIVFIFLISSWFSPERLHYPFSTQLFNIVLEVLTTAIRKEKEISVPRLEKKLNSLYGSDMILYIEDPKDITRKILELINEFGKSTGYKINTQKFLAFLYANSERSERQIQETILFTIASKRVKYLEINLPKETKDFYPENRRCI